MRHWPRLITKNPPALEAERYNIDAGGVCQLHVLVASGRAGSCTLRPCGGACAHQMMLGQFNKLKRGFNGRPNKRPRPLHIEIRTDNIVVPWTYDIGHPLPNATSWASVYLTNTSRP